MCEDAENTNDLKIVTINSTRYEPVCERFENSVMAVITVVCPCRGRWVR